MECTASFSGPLSWNTPSTNAASESVRTKVVSALPPMSMTTASRMMDLPAPVSPVRMIRPGPNRRSSLSIMAKFCMWSSVSIGFRLSEQLDSRKSGIYNRGSEDKIDHLKENTEKITSKYLDQNDRQGAKYHACCNSHEQGTRPTTICNTSHPFSNCYSSSRGASGDQEPSEEADTAYQRNKEGRNCRKHSGYKKAKNKIVPFCCFECFLSFTHTFLAAISRRCAHCTLRTDGALTVITAQGGLAGWVNVAI